MLEPACPPRTLLLYRRRWRAGAMYTMTAPGPSSTFFSYPGGTVICVVFWRNWAAVEPAVTLPFPRTTHETVGEANPARPGAVWVVVAMEQDTQVVGLGRI